MQVLTVPHHGSRKNSDYEFYDVFFSKWNRMYHCSQTLNIHIAIRMLMLRGVITRMGFVEIPVTKEEKSL